MLPHHRSIVVEAVPCPWQDTGRLAASQLASYSKPSAVD